MIKVLRMTRHDYDDLVQSWGSKARFLDVPSTLGADVKFRGCYVDATCKSIAVPWPIDRPDFAQREFAETYKCGWPVDEFELKELMN